MLSLPVCMWHVAINSGTMVYAPPVRHECVCGSRRGWKAHALIAANLHFLPTKRPTRDVHFRHLLAYRTWEWVLQSLRTYVLPLKTKAYLSRLTQHSSSSSVARNDSRPHQNGDQSSQRNSWRASSTGGAAAALFFARGGCTRGAVEWCHGLYRRPGPSKASFGGRPINSLVLQLLQVRSGKISNAAEGVRKCSNDERWAWWTE